MALPPDHLDALRAALAAAPDLRAASAAVIDHLATVPSWLPSLYLERGGRLRCQAVRGYWQIRDGFPPGAGVIGRTFASGEAAFLPDTAGDQHYLEAHADVRAEACVPITLDGRVAGVVNVESTTTLPAEALPQLEAVAAAYADRLRALGGPPRATPAERLVGHLGALAGVTDAAAVERRVLAAARDVTGMDTAMLLRRDGFGRMAPRRAEGPLAAAMMAGTAESFAIVESFTAAGTSCYTAAVLGDEEPTGMHVLAHAGVQSLLGVAIPGAGGSAGILVVADAAPHVPTTEVVGLLELLAAQTASCLRVAEAMDELRERAARDPLTGLGHHATFHAAVARERTARRSVAVLMADVDGFKAINDTRGHQAGDRVLREVAAELSGALRRGDELFRIGGDEFAAIVAVGDEEEALDAGRRLREAAAATGSVTVSVGIALPRAGESDASVLARADRALYAVKQAGRDGVAVDRDPAG
ncbi:MAG TPA: diguanylate cyclase [Capillimicrobium sp.]